MDCFSSCIKHIVFILNLILFLFGVAVIGVSAYVFIKANDYQDFMGGGYTSGPSILIAAGVLVALVSFLGCCGAMQESSCMMYTHATIITLLLIVEIGAVVAALVYKKDARDLVSKVMVSEEAKYGTDEHLSKAWDSIQEAFECCGIRNYTDWGSNESMNKSSVPDSCCIERGESGCGKGMLTDPHPEKTINTQGCLDVFVDSIKDHYGLAGGIVAGFGVFQLMAIVVSCCLAKKMGDKGYIV